MTLILWKFELPGRFVGYQGYASRFSFGRPSDKSFIDAAYERPPPKM